MGIANYATGRIISALAGTRPLTSGVRLGKYLGMLPRIGFIGCGAFSTSCLYPSLRLLAFGLEPYGSEPEVELVACCDMDESLAERNARAFGFRRAYTDYRAMLDKEELDTVFVVMHPRLQ